MRQTSKPQSQHEDRCSPDRTCITGQSDLRSSTWARKQQMNTDTKWLGPQLLLPDEIRTSLSKEAVLVYVKLWNKMRIKEKTDIWISDRVLSVSAHVDYDLIPQVKRELVSSGLFEIKEGKWPAEDPPNICHRYRFSAVEPETASDPGIESDIKVNVRVVKSFRVDGLLAESGVLATLSGDALRLYLLICHRIRKWQTETVSLDADTVSWEIGLSPEQTEAARTELRTGNLIDYSVNSNFANYKAVGKLL